MNTLFRLSAFFFFLCPFLLPAQRQISNIEFFQKFDNHAGKGFIPIGEEEYFIEQGAGATKISLIKNGQLDLLHRVTDRPARTSYNWSRREYTHSNSGLIYEGNILYELYSRYFYAIDILSGQTDHIVDLNAFDAVYLSDFIVTVDHYFFYGQKDNVRSYFAYGRQTGELTRVEFGEGLYVSRVRERLYGFDIVSDKLLSYDLLTETLDSIATATSGQFYLKSLKLNGETQLIVSEGDSSAVYLIDQDYDFNRLDCLDGKSPKELYPMSDRLLYTLEGNDSVYVIDRQDCRLLNTYSLPGELSVRDSRELFDEYVLFSDVADWSGIATFVLYDVAEQTFTRLDLIADSPYMDRAVRYDDKLYFVVWDDIHYIGTLPEIFSLDLKTKRIEKIDDYQRDEVYNIVIGEHQEDGQLHIYYDTEGESALQSYRHIDQELQEIREFDYLKNRGIHHNIYEHIWHEDKLFFFSLSALYVMENDQIFKILDTDPDANNFTTSAFIVKRDKLHILLGQDSDVYKVSVDVNDFSYERKRIDGVDGLDYRRPATTSGNVLLNIPNSNVNNTGYYDLRDEQFKAFYYNGQPINSFSYTLSGDNILFRRLASTQKWVLFNTETESSVLTEIPDGESVEAYPDGAGGFYLTPWRFSRDYPHLMHLNGEGKISVLTEDFQHLLFYGGERLDGAVKSLAFDGEDEMIIFSGKGDDYHITRIPDNGLLYYQQQSYFWKETDQLSVLQVPNGINQDTYIFSFGTDPLKITPNGRNQRLVEAFVEDDKIVLLYLSGIDGTLSFEDYEFASGNTVLRQSLLVNTRNFSSHFIQYAEGQYLLTLDDQVYGSEPWLYNSKTGSLQLLEDMRGGFASSFPRQYMLSSNGTDVYFVAQTEGLDRQLFKLDQSVNLQQIDRQATTIVLFPSPSQGSIHLDRNLKNVRILGLSGQLLFQLSSYTENEALDLSGLANGLYYLVGTTEEGQPYRGKFILQRN